MHTMMWLLQQLCWDIILQPDELVEAVAVARTFANRLAWHAALVRSGTTRSNSTRWAIIHRRPQIMEHEGQKHPQQDVAKEPADKALVFTAAAAAAAGTSGTLRWAGVMGCRAIGQLQQNDNCMLQPFDPLPFHLVQQAIAGASRVSTAAVNVAHGTAVMHKLLRVSSVHEQLHQVFEVYVAIRLHLQRVHQP